MYTSSDKLYRLALVTLSDCGISQSDLTICPLIKALKENIRLENNKISRNYKPSKTVDKLMSNIKKDKRDSLIGYHLTSDNKFIFTDGYVLFKSDTNYGYSEAKPMISSNALNNILQKPEDLIKIDLDLGAIAEHKSYIKACKEINKQSKRLLCPFVISIKDKFKIGFDVDRLESYIKFTESNTIWVSKPTAGGLHLDDNCNVDAVIMPIKLLPDTNYIINMEV